MKPCIAFASLVALTLPALPDSFEGPRVEALERLIPQLMQDGEVPGLSIALIHRSKISWHRAFGFANAQERLPLNESSVFESASLTKPLFACAVLKLADRGVIRR
jgi:CubicO group peptidase (beta-lactamase class C family)